MASTRNEKSARNIVYIIWKQVFLLLLNFFAKTVFIKVLGKEYLGLNGIFNNIFLLFSFAEFGMGTAMIYSFYEPFARQEREKCAALYQYFRKLYWFMSVGFVAAGLLVVPFLSIIVDVRMPMEKVILFYLLYMAGSFLNNLFLYKANLLVADQNQYIVSKIQLLVECLAFTAQIIVVWVWESFELYIGIIILKYIGMGILYHLKVRKLYPYVEMTAEELSETEKREIQDNTKTLFIYKFSKTLINATDNIIISMLVGTVWVGLYSNYEFVIAGIWSIITALFSALSASVGNLLVEKDREKQHRIYCVIEMLNIWCGGFTAVCLAVLFQDFIELWVGKGYELSVPVMLVIVLNYYLRCLREGIAMFREAAGLFRRFKNVTVITAALNISLSFLMGHFWGIGGIFAATVVSVLVTYFWYEPYLVYKELFQRSVKPYFIRQANHIAATLLMGTFVFLLCGKLPSGRIDSFILKGVCCVLLPNLFFLLYFRKTEQFSILMEQAKDLVKKRKGKHGE